jgi:YidC/Oxa1 family membrane protein insertase
VGQEKNVEKRLFLAIVLSMAVLMIWNILFVPVPSGPRRTPPGAADQPAVPGQAPAPARAAAPGMAPEPGALSAESEPERSLVIDTPLYRAVVTNRGAAISSFQLKAYARKPRGDERVELVPQPEEMKDYFHEDYAEADKRLVLSRLSEEIRRIWLPFSLRLPEIPDGLLLGQSTFQMEPSSGDLRLTGSETAQIRFRKDFDSGLSVIKTLTFHADTYATDINFEIRNSGTAPLAFTPEIVVTEGFRSTGIPQTGQYNVSSPVYGSAGKRRTPDIGNKDEQKITQAPNLQWAGYEDLYFFSTLLPGSRASTVLVEKTRVLGLIRVLVRFEPVQIDPGQSVPLTATGFVGPKEIDRLESFGHDLDRIIDYGMFRFVAVPAVQILKFIHRVTGSWGLAIIVLTILLKIVTYPLTNAQLKSMEKMKAIAPELERLKARFKDAKDPERYNKEMMGLYKKHGVNPAAGCLPMLIQLPIFIALYNGLLYSIDLRHTAFLYIPDLSAPDPYFISPLLMGASMLLQMRLSPTPADPTQATMMKVMPILFMGFFLFAPAGLVIYWLMNNILSIGQQLYLRRIQALQTK